LTLVKSKEKRKKNEGRTNKHYVSDAKRVKNEAGIKELKIKNSRLKISQ
jgi:hypothetical protein